ncbi:peptide-methionine (S)-S-oxide reductase [Hydrocarboniphaga daqingensis]|jgi:peptide-methionine (S)-S-oxide reductase|uniref:Peptide methionine sulfoxide reductase MsrA n=1 Tax=Hydrocarboniphaga daqingensis TaxID=490188 RepID=A0A1M5QT66_9GAMM|nr:peptide-methionine (S)-S-oxide reductase MsrA [Hydrocarboniphaga daqingensis]SHH17091.1 peptide-methionine (S)-S-oxide reductase [Hydrocarboniphaga daqingensis]
MSSLFGGTGLRVSPRDVPAAVVDEPRSATPGRKLAVLAGGCFWCVEAVYREVDGVLDVVNGYSGGSAETADYKTVCTGRTEHAEVVQIAYDPSRTSFGALLKIFFAVAHDPTQLNRQGNDLGTQYRSAIFYADDEQQRIARAYIEQLDAAQVYGAPIVTRLEKLDDFFEAEAYHQNYAALHPNEGYIAGVALPKVDKLRRYFGEVLKR